MKKILFADGKVVIGLSTVADGNMRTIGKSGAPLRQVRQNRINFLAAVDLTPEQTVLVMIDYDSDNFCRFDVASRNWRGNGMVANRPVKTADGLATTTHDLGLFLPLADCLGAVIYDPEHAVLMVSHLGRHATEQNGAAASLAFLTQNYQTNPSNLQIWLSPSAGADNYPLYSFDNQSLRSVNINQLLAAGVSISNISGRHIDTTTDQQFFSHSQSRDNQRFAIVAKIK
jgi:copper oxidase (laccase) domain-containing protein